jgi:lipopolysaccharide transport system permease protein
MKFSPKWIWRRDLVLVLLHKDLTVRYKGSVLGFLWSILNPLSQAFIFYLVFSVYMRFTVPHFLVALLVALFPWQWFSSCVNEGPHTFAANPTLVKKVAFPRQAIPLVMNLQNMVHFILALPVYACFMLADGLYPGWVWLPGIPLLLLVTLASAYGLCLFLGALNLFLRDIGNLVAVLTQMAFFAAPIMYTMSVVPEEYHWYFKLNPFAPMVICWRSLLMDNEINMFFLPVALGYAALFMLCGVLVFGKLQRRFAEVM